MPYKLIKLDSVNQEIWETDNKKRIASFITEDFTTDFMPNLPQTIVDILNGKKVDAFDRDKVMQGLLSVCNTKDKKHNELVETIEGLKVGGQGLNFVLPKPHKHLDDCVTNTILYETQYSLAKKQWSAYYSRFYNKRPGEHDYLVQRCHRNDLHHMRNIDGKWFVKVTIKGKTVREYVGKDEEEAKKRRDIILKNAGFEL